MSTFIIRGTFDGDPAEVWWEDGEPFGHPGVISGAEAAAALGEPIQYSDEGAELKADLEGEVLAALFTLRDQFDFQTNVEVYVSPDLVYPYRRSTWNPLTGEPEPQPDPVELSVGGRPFDESDVRRDWRGRFSHTLGTLERVQSMVETPVLGAFRERSLDDLKRELERRGVVAGFDGLNLTQAREVAFELVALLDKHPTSLGYVGTDKDPAKPEWVNKQIDYSYAWARSGASDGGSYILLNNRWFQRERDEFAAVIAESSRTNWHPQGFDTPAAVISHEYAHHIDFAILKSKDEALLVTHRELRKQLREGHFGEISDYALTDDAEAFAETFVMLRQGDDQSLAARVLKDHLEKQR